MKVIFWHKIESSYNGILSIIKTFDLVPKKNLRILALDQMYCWLRNRAKNLAISTISINLKTFDLVPKNNLQILALDRKLKITQNDINTTFDQVPKKNGRILALDRIINKTFDQVTTF